MSDLLGRVLDEDQIYYPDPSEGIKDRHVAPDAAIAQSKINGLIARLQQLENAIGAGGGGGGGGNSGVSTFVAGTNLSADRVVVTSATGEASLADPSDLTQINAIAGITTQAVVLGRIVEVRHSGKQAEPSWNWTPQKPLFVGSGGQLTQTVPTSGLMIIVGWAIDATSIFVQIQNRVKRI